MRGRHITWLLLACILWGSPALAQDRPFAAADMAMAAGDLETARQQVLAVMAAHPAPQIVGAGALRLSTMADLTGDATAAEQPLHEALKFLSASDTAAQPVLAAIYVQLGALALARGDSGRAQLALMKGIAIGRHVAPGDPLVLEAELTLAVAETRAFRLDAAQQRLQDLAPRIAAAPPRLNALYQSALGELAFRQYRYAPALAAMQLASDLFAELYGREHPEFARAETSRGSSLFNAGQYLAAERALQNAVTIYDRQSQLYAPALAVALVNLGQIYYTTGRLALADIALSRALDLSRGGNQTEAAALLHRGFTRLRQNELAAAVADLKAAIAIWSAPATRNPRAAAGAEIWLAEALRRQGDLAAATAALGDAARVLTEIFGADSYAMTDVLVGEGEIALVRGAPHDALAPLRKALAIRAGQLGDDHIAVLEVKSQLGLALARDGDLTAGLAMSAEVEAAVRRRLTLSQAAQTGGAIDEVAALRRFIGRQLAVIALTQEQTPALAAQSLSLAQLARASAAGSAIASLGQRQALTDPQAAAALREVQEAALRWQMAERSLSAEVAAQAGDHELAADIAETKRLADLATIAQAAFQATYPDATAASSREVKREDISAVLRDGEVALAYLILEDQSFLWVLSRQGVTFKPLSQAGPWLAQQVRALRATVDPRQVTDLSELAAFDTVAASDLYQVLIGPAGLTPDIRHLIIVPDGALQSLPFAALLSHSVPATDDLAAYRGFPWLIRDVDLAILPDLAALPTLRSSVRPSAATLPFFGIGNPVLGATAAGDEDDLAATLRSLPPLPDTADELAAIAEILKAGPQSTVTGPAATEAALKEMPLGDFRALVIATHGLVAGDFGRLREPGLVLTPPPKAVGTDDGLLTVGEIAGLKLDADWVVLSACNTAAADGSPGAEGLSGLARGFFFAGSRALLVSQWEVLSAAAVQLTTGTFQAMERNPSEGRAAALRQAMLALQSEDQFDYLSHPIFWAPFELVGEGG